MYETESVVLVKGHQGLGINVRGGTDFPFIQTPEFVDPGIFIVKINEDGFARQDGRLKVGDKIVCVNGTNVENVTHREFVRLFAAAGKEDLRLNVIHDAAERMWRRKHDASLRNAQDGDHASFTELPQNFFHLNDELKSFVPEQSQEGFLRVPRSVSPAFSLTSRPDEGDLESLTSLVSEADRAFDDDDDYDASPRPPSSMEGAMMSEVTESFRRVEPYGVLEIVEEATEEDESEFEGNEEVMELEAANLYDVSVKEGEREDLDKDVALKDLDAALEARHSDRDSLDSDSDEELKKCRESVCPESHEVTPQSSSTNLSPLLESPTKTDDSAISCRSSATPETVISRLSWHNRRSVAATRMPDSAPTVTPEPLETSKSEPLVFSALDDPEEQEEIIEEDATEVATAASYSTVGRHDYTGECCCEEESVEANPEEDYEDSERVCVGFEDKDRFDEGIIEFKNSDAEKVELFNSTSREGYTGVFEDDLSHDAKRKNDPYEEEIRRDIELRVASLRERLLKQEEKAEEKEEGETSGEGYFTRLAPFVCVAAIAAIAAFVIHRQIRASKSQ